MSQNYVVPASISPNGNAGTTQYSWSQDTTSTGIVNPVIMIPTTALAPIGVTLKVLSTAQAKLQLTNSSPQAVIAGTAVWYDAPAPFVVTSASTVGGVLNGPITAIAVNVTTGLAGKQVLLDVRTNNPNY